MDTTNLAEVKAIIISLSNIHPNGIYIDKLDSEFKKQEGQRIPFGKFGYSHLLQFLTNEFKDKLRITTTENNNWSTMIYPIANNMSGHIVEFTRNPLKGRRGASRNTNRSQENGRNAQAGLNSNMNSQPSTSSATNRSPSMPRLIRYQPFLKHPWNLTNGEKLIHDRLMQSQKAFLQQNQKNKNQNQQIQMKNPNSSRNSVSQLNKQLNGMKLQDDLIKTTTVNSTQPRSGRSFIENTEKPSASSCATSISNTQDFQNIWHDEFANNEPPKRANSNSSSIYNCVSDMSVSNTTESSHESFCVKLMESSTDDEQPKHYPINDMFSGLNVGDTIPVRVSEVNNPLKFWIHICRKENKSQLIQLFTEMQEYYTANKNSPELKLTDPDESGDDYFAVYFEHEWHRVEILDARMGESVRVSFIDHGTREIVNISDMRRLVKQFQNVPKAGVCCALANVKPIGKSFTTSDAYKFMELVDGEELYARILHIDNNKSKAFVELIVSKNKLCINDEFIRLGIAVKKEVYRAPA